jgi:hypothetical protein
MLSNAEGKNTELINQINEGPCQAQREGQEEGAFSKLLEELKLTENPLLHRRPDIRNGLEAILRKYQEVFSTGDNKFGRTTLIEAEVRVKAGTVPVRQRLRPLNPKQEADLRAQLDEWIDCGVVRPSASPWATPLVPIKKKNGETRWCCDFRRLNSCTIADAYPLPKVSECLHRLRGSRVFSSLDARAAYWTIPMKEESRHLTAFITPFGLFEWNVLPFGLMNAGAQYSRYVAQVLRDLPPERNVHYLDDVLPHDRNEEEHLENLEAVLRAHLLAGLRLNPEKTQFFMTSVRFLGHAAGIGMVPEYIDRIVNWPLPSTGKEMQTALGFLGYYRSAIPNYAVYTKEMNKQRNDKKIVWTEDMKKNFGKLKRAFKTAPLRAFPQYESSEPFRLTTDFSAVGLGAILSQYQGGHERLIAAASRGTTKYEANYASYKGEIAALVLGLRKFKHLLLFKQFHVFTDSAAVRDLTNLKEPSGILARWLIEMAQYDMKIFHKAGKLNRNADSLSRATHLNPPSAADEREAAEYVGALTSPPLSRENIRREQGNDPVLQEVVRWHQEGVPGPEELRGQPLAIHRYRQLFDCLKQAADGVWFFPFRLNSPAHEKAERLLIPESLQEAVFDQLHKHGTAGHFGGTATVARGNQRFFWPGMGSDLRKAVATCGDCMAKHQKTNAREGTHHPRRAGFPFQRLFIDLVGPLPETSRGHRYIMTVEDHYTRWVNAYSIPNKETATVARTLCDRFVMVWGCPYSILSDNGMEFSGSVFKEMLKMLMIERVNSPPYNPQSNPVERFHRTLNSLLRVFMDRESTAWEEHLPTAVFAYNSKQHSSTGLSPYFALMGREPRLPVDLLIRLPGENELPISDFAKMLRKRFRVMADFIKSNTQGVIERNSHQYEGRTNDWKVGDLVWYFLPRQIPGKPKKLTNNWTGPFKVTEIVAPVLLKIVPANSEGVERVVHLTRIRKYHQEDGNTRTIPRGIEYDDDDDEEAQIIRSGSFPVPTRELGVPVYMPVPVEEIQDRINPAPDMVEEVLPAAEAGPSSVRDAVMEEGVLPAGSQASVPEVLGDREVPELMDVAGHVQPGAAQPAAEESRRALVEKRRRPPETATSDTSVERPRNPRKKVTFLQRVRKVVGPLEDTDTSGTEEGMALIQECGAVQVLETLPEAGELCSLLAPVSQNLSPGQSLEVQLKLVLLLPEGWGVGLKEAVGPASQGIRVVGGSLHPAQRGRLKIVVANLSDKLYRIRQGQRLAVARIQRNGENVEEPGNLVLPGAMERPSL